MTPLLRITQFTDPGCPWAWSAEPFRRHLSWRYGDQLEWVTHLVVLAEDPAEYEAKGLTPEFFAKGFAKISAEHGMPIDTTVRARNAATLPACRAVVAARLHGAPGDADTLLRALRIRTFANEGLLDEEATVFAAATAAGVDGQALQEWKDRQDVEDALRADMAAARSPSPAALAQDKRLGAWEGGRRYTCPSYEFESLETGQRISAPGFQQFMTYEVCAGTLVPEAHQRPKPDSVEELLAWAGEPLATQEVAQVCELTARDARQQLGQVAGERHLGADGLWSPSG
jgi:2-hydroxychromene-2-carboxylate isomerase